MTETMSKSRERAEAAFAQTQTQFFSRVEAVAELNAHVAERDSKTARLKAARLAKEIEDRASATAALIAKRAKKA
ncbi:MULTISPECIES: hypothetical protein [Rhizobium/Agrobacterium group]|jgi:hypothetical protein|uniref:ElaB/YqjD/DUF883 family membrane-anchored ribosome-binding protein n=1 Tax=Rhizobium soli TaxID=424798 RepID=A0A7X0MT53_9HYPH|nr:MULTISPECIES: hypothetical protein [Rhizobium/Agrobacterium group]RYE66464.1 MAG: hypothetical protein EOP17_11280 [Rhizobiaceae bacterium]KQQ35310.1 hypothetical protein ASG19_16460 [Rhizobium sp. Leaf306]KQQ75083.1 hypothetical protein ASF70_04180 [Rhizobium sp. Leaf321]MBB6510076.1 ElaB/YqjD/DUF883 family membrane-anchored ribosome-binding protein [Rhizobium soli]MBD8653032.1 hypothetical protein [Rhizobium sp. CFBP 13726]